MQVQDGVGDNAGRLFLVSPGRHHEDGNAPSLRSPEHDFISLYNTLAEDEEGQEEKSWYVTLSTACDSNHNFFELCQAENIMSMHIPLQPPLQHTREGLEVARLFSHLTSPHGSTNKTLEPACMGGTARKHRSPVGLGIEMGTACVTIHIHYRAIF